MHEDTLAYDRNTIGTELDGFLVVGPVTTKFKLDQKRSHSICRSSEDVPYSSGFGLISGADNRSDL